ncbi:MAG: protein translocase subunit SecF [Candidatus Eremiobacterota bacterium]
MDIKLIEVAAWVIGLTAFVVWGQSFRKKQRDLMGNRRYFYMFSALVTLIALGGILARGLHWGLDFTGGTMIEMGSLKMLTAPEIRTVIDQEPALHGDKLKLADVQVQVSASQIPNLGPRGEPLQKVMVRLTQGEKGRQLEADQTELVKTALSQKLQLIPLSEQSIGATISGELRANAFMALVITLGLQLIYIFVRFGQQMRFGVAADIALVHDVIIMVGIYALAGRQVDSPFIAALLTVTGYSVMDSVVIFDRIRENLRTIKGASFAEVVNASVNQTMTRSINTTLTPVLTLLAIYFFGGSTLQNFAFALLVGILSGAYSSICVASPLLIEIDNWAMRREKERLAMRRQLAEEKASERKRRERPPRDEEVDPVEKAMEGAQGGRRRRSRRG